MKLMSATLLLSIGSAGLGGGCAHAPNPEADLTAARALFGRNLRAIQDKDRDAYLACYRQDERLLRNGPGGPVRGFDGLAASTATVPASWLDIAVRPRPRAASISARCGSHELATGLRLGSESVIGSMAGFAAGSVITPLAGFGA